MAIPKVLSSIDKRRLENLTRKNIASVGGSKQLGLEKTRNQLKKGGVLQEAARRFQNGQDINTPKDNNFTTPGGTIVPLTTPTTPTTPMPTSTTNPVVDGSQTVGGTPTSTDNLQFNGKTITDILIKRDQNKSLNSQEQNLLSKFKVKLSQGVIDKNTFFQDSNPSTITTTPLKVSNEVALDVASKILKGDKSLSDLGLQQGASDTRITDFLNSQGQTPEQIKAIFNARDELLKEKRLNGGLKTRIESRQQEIQTRIANETDKIRKQVERSQQLLKEQRNLRGTGRSSTTEFDLQDLQNKGDKLINLATAKGNTELAIFKAQQEGANSEQIQSLQKNLREQTQLLNQEILNQSAIENQLVAKGKLENNVAFDNLISSLNISGVKTGGANKFASESTGYLSVKSGNAILNSNGVKIPVGGKTKTDVNTISNFADGLIQGKISFGSVPTSLRGNVINVWALKFNDKSNSLSATQLADAPLLAKSIFGNIKETSQNAIKSLMQQGLTNEQIKQRTKDIGFSDAYNGSVVDGLNFTTTKFSKDNRNNIKNLMDNLLSNGKNNKAIDLLLKSARDGATAQQQDKITGLGELVTNLTRIRTSIKKLTPEQLDGITYTKVDTGETRNVKKTDLVTGITTLVKEKIFNLVGQSSDPRISQIATEIGIAIQAYRQSRSGAAFSESEAKEYADLFPGIGKDFKLNLQRIKGVLNTAETATNNFYNQKIGGTNFRQIFPNGAMNTLHPGEGFIGKSFLINPSGTSDEILKSLNNPINNIGGKIGDTKNINTPIPTSKSSSIDKSNFLDGGQGLNSPDQTGGTKVQNIVPNNDKIVGILGNLKDKVTINKKGGDNPTLGLSGGSLTFRTNNPLAITATQPGTADRLSNKFGAINNLFSPDSSNNLVLNFRTKAEGLKAGRQLLEEKKNLSINNLLESHTGGPALAHKAEAKRLGLDLTRTFASLSEEEKNKVIEAIKVGEGFKKGIINS